MLVYIQWTRNNPGDWERYDITRARDIRQLPRKPAPTPGGPGLRPHVLPEHGPVWVPDETDPANDEPGWVFDLSVAGIHMAPADHYYIARNGSRLDITRWADDQSLADEGDRFAHLWSFGPHSLHPSNGLPVPDIELTVWAESPERRAIYEGRRVGDGASIVTSDWSDFVPPTSDVLHGVWLPDERLPAFGAARTHQAGLIEWAAGR